MKYLKRGAVLLLSLLAATILVYLLYYFKVAEGMLMVSWAAVIYVFSLVLPIVWMIKNLSVKEP